MKTIKYVLGFISSIALLSILFFTTIELSTFNVDFFMEEAKINDVAQVTNLKEAQLEKLYSKLLLYLKGDTPDLDITVEKNGTISQAFNDKEKSHMKDVLVLFNYGFSIRNISAVIFVILLAFAILTKNSKRYFARSGFLLFSIVGILFVILLVLITLNFQKYFTIFHEILFTNDDWLLNPQTDLLINLLPQNIFFNIATKIVVWFMLEIITCLTIFHVLKKRSNI